MPCPLLTLRCLALAQVVRRVSEGLGKLPSDDQGPAQVAALPCPPIFPRLAQLFELPRSAPPWTWPRVRGNPGSRVLGDVQGELLNEMKVRLW